MAGSKTHGALLGERETEAFVLKCAHARCWCMVLEGRFIRDVLGSTWLVGTVQGNFSLVSW